MGSIALQIDVGRWLQLIFVLDTLEGFEETAFAGANIDACGVAADFDKWRDNCRDMASQKPHFCGGLTVIIGCGVGRAAHYRLSGNQREDWRTVFLGAPDAETLSDVRHIDAKSIWRILDAQDRLSAYGVKLINLKGLLNLIAWVRSLDGHLVEHSQVPLEWHVGGGRLMIDPTMVREFRREAAAKVDRHAVQKVDGEWTEVRKTDRSLFAEDRAVPLYVPTRIDSDGQLPMIYEGTNRYWWCRVTAPHEYARWKLMSTWLPRIARVLDKSIASLPAIILIEVAFNGYELPHNNREAELSREAIEADIRVKVDQVSMSLAIEAGVFFEEGLGRPENIAEAALVASIVRGCIDLAGNNAGIAREPLVQAIVQNEQARDTHAFQARRFRDFIGDQLRDTPVGIDSIDTAKLRLGLGWSARSPDKGGEIEGRSECNAFLNAVVSQLEEEFCIELRRFNRRSLVEFALRKHLLNR